MNEVQELLLRIIGSSLFSSKKTEIKQDQLIILIRESKAQAVFPLLFSVLDDQLKEMLNSEQYNVLSADFLRYAIASTQNFADHGELHELMIGDSIPYVIMKGLASAMYYPEPSLRSMGDVDFLVFPKDLERAGKVLHDSGFAIDHGEGEDSLHIAYHRSPMSIWELHRNVNGVPNGEIGERIQLEINETIKTSNLISIDGNSCYVPDVFHHGLILLLHTASHLTSEGIGLRHLCDWTVFVSSLSDTVFRQLFEKKLKRFGLWQFAQALTLLGIRYLGAPKRVWALEALADILGHTTTEITELYYVRRESDKLNGVTDGFEL